MDQLHLASWALANTVPTDTPISLAISRYDAPPPLVIPGVGLVIGELKG
jgi:hypothetical protein